MNNSKIGFLVSFFFTLIFRSTNGGIGFSSTNNTKPEKILYPALEVILQGNTIILPQNDEDSNENIELNGSQKFLYLCFGEQAIQFSFQYNYINRKCLFPKKITSQREIVTCGEEVIPTRMKTPIKCGSDDRDVLELIYHEDKATILNEIIIVYSFCSRSVVTEIPDEPATKKEETVFVRYEISSYELKRQPRPEKFKTNFYPNSCRISSCNYMSKCYKKKNQRKALELMFPGIGIGDDYLAEQMMVSIDDIMNDIAADSLANYINIKPQWKSLQEDWEILGMYIREQSKLASMQANSFSDPQNNSHNGFVIYSGTYGEFEDTQNRKIQIGKPPLKSAELAKSRIPETRLIIDVSRLNYSQTCTIPIYWWKLVVATKSNTGIIIGLLNHPKQIGVSQHVEPLCKDVCHLYGWQEVKNINNDIFCCEPETKLLQKLLLHFSMYVEFEGTLDLNEESDSEENSDSSLDSNNLFFIAGDRYFSDNLRTNPQYYQVLW